MDDNNISLKDMEFRRQRPKLKQQKRDELAAFAKLNPEEAADITLEQCQNCSQMIPIQMKWLFHPSLSSEKV